MRNTINTLRLKVEDWGFSKKLLEFLGISLFSLIPPPSKSIHLVMFFALLTLIPHIPPLHAATLSATSCSQDHVQEAIDQAAHGDFVFVPPGNCTWTKIVFIPNTRGITLYGAGIGKTIIKDEIFKRHDEMLHIKVNPSYVTRVSGFTFDANGQNQMDKLIFADRVITLKGEGIDKFRIDNNEFLNLLYRGIRIEQEGLELYGVIDHNIFNCSFETNADRNSSCQSVSVLGDDPQQSEHMARPYEPGSNKFIFFEDNILNYAGKNDGGLEGYGGARYVLRHNQFHGVTTGHHGVGSAFRGTHSFEIYNNSFDQEGCTGCTGAERKHQLRSGTGFIFNNTYTWSGRIHLDNYRSNITAVDRKRDWFWKICDGTQPHDGNLEANGYPCMDQIGYVFTNILDGTHSHEPLYIFHNTENGMQTDAIVNTGHNADIHIKEDRDFYNQDPNFDGTKGVGTGLLRDRPKTCTINVGYWATDTNTFYQCDSQDTWVVYYKPYTYPHPLATGALPSAPLTSSAGLESVTVYPNPVIVGTQGKSITFAPLPLNTTIKIFTIAGEHVVTLPILNNNSTNTWDLKDESGNDVASGIYTYVLSTEERDKKNGQVAIIR